MSLFRARFQATFRSTPRITRKFILYLMTVSVLPLLAVGYASYQSARDTVLVQARENVRVLVEGQVALLEHTLDQVENLIANLSGVEEISSGLAREEPQDDYGRLATQARIGYILNGYLNLEGLVSIDIFSADGQHFHVGDTLDASRLDQATRDRLHAQALASGRTVYWAGLVDNVNEASRHPRVLAAARVLMRTDRTSLTTRPIGLIIVNLDLKSLSRVFSATPLSPGALLTLIDQQGALLFDVDPDRVGGPADPELTPLTRTPHPAGTRVELRGSPQLLDCAAVPRTGWTLCHALPEQALFDRIAVIRNTGLLALLLSFLVVAVATWLYSRDLVRPIREIIQSFKRLEADTLDPATRLPVHTRDEIGELVGWFNAFMDILAARAAAEQALRVSEQRYALAVEATNDIVWDWDLRTETLYLSPRFQEVLGLTDIRLNRCLDDWLSRVHPHDIDAVHTEIWRHLDGASAFFRFEYRMRHANGAYLWFLSRGLAERDRDGRPARMAGSHTDVSDRRRAEERLRHGALHDTLTGLYNRTWLNERLQQILNGSRVSDHRGLALLFIDLDGFKNVNDTLGHGIGDALLVAVATRLRAEVRAQDGLVRLGGDEFVVLIESGLGGVELAERLIASLARPFLLREQEVQTGASIGIAQVDPAYRSAEEILRDADIAMYRAKERGKGRFQVFDQGMRERILARLDMERTFARALAAETLGLVYQPIVSMNGYRLIGFEALARWVHPTLGTIPPDQFIALAQECNLIGPFGRWTFAAVCRRLHGWQALVPPDAPLSVAVNFSPRQLLDEELIEAIPRILRETGVNGEHLIIEVTETAILHETAAAAVVLARLRALGIRVHLDDFGTGYSSLSHLAGLPIDAIKIDRSFVSEIETSERKRVMLHGLILIAHELGIETVAEGVETEGQARILLAEGCDHCQGYLVSYPLTPGDAARLLSSQTALTDTLRALGQGAGNA